MSEQEVNIGEEIHTGTDPATEPVDNTGFNPDIHCVDEKGNPRRTKTGKFRLKPNFARSGGTNDPGNPVDVDPMQEFSNPAPISTIQAIQMILSLGSMMAVKAFGEEWKFTDPEQQMLTDVWARYCHFRGWDMDQSPELVVIMTTLAVLLPRITSPNFLKRFKRVNNAHTDNGSNKNGENNTGENNRQTDSGGGEGGDSVRPIIERMG
jgi:hypothetical protein